MSNLGTQENPCRSNYDINKIIRGMQNCNIYTLRTFEISEENLEQAKARKIIFIGLAQAYLKMPVMKKAQVELKRKENFSEIGIDNNTKLPVNLDEIAKQITQQFNINTDIFNDAMEKSALELQQRYDKYQEMYKSDVLGEWL